jgi:hypothetical protein
LSLVLPAGHAVHVESPALLNVPAMQTAPAIRQHDKGQ